MFCYKLSQQIPSNICFRHLARIWPPDTEDEKILLKLPQPKEFDISYANTEK